MKFVLGIYLNWFLSIYLCILKFERVLVFFSKDGMWPVKAREEGITKREEWKNKISDDKAGLGGAEKFWNSQTARTWLQGVKI